MKFIEHNSEDYNSVKYKFVGFVYHSNIWPLEVSKRQADEKLPAGSFIHTQIVFSALTLAF